jgi:hypothetical protein
MGLEILKTPQVYRLTSAESPHDDPHHRVVCARRKVAKGRIAAEVDELANQILDVGS